MSETTASPRDLTADGPETTADEKAHGPTVLALDGGNSKTDVLLIDDWGLAPLTDESRRDLLEIFDDRHGTRATIITSQLPVKHWHEAIGDPTLADAILDRLVHQAHSLNLDGESLRKKGKPE